MSAGGQTMARVNIMNGNVQASSVRLRCRRASLPDRCFSAAFAQPLCFPWCVISGGPCTGVPTRAAVASGRFGRRAWRGTAKGGRTGSTRSGARALPSLRLITSAKPAVVVGKPGLDLSRKAPCTRLAERAAPTVQHRRLPGPRAEHAGRGAGGQPPGAAPARALARRMRA